VADILGKAVLEISTDTKDIKASLDDLKRQLGDTAKSAQGIEEGVNLEIFKEFAKISLEALATVAEGILELGKRGAQVNDISESFDALAEHAHSTGDAMLGALRAGTQGTIADFELMKMSSGLLSSGLITTTGDMQSLANGALMLGKATGTDAKSAFETMVKAIETGRTKGLKQLDLFVDSKAATDAYAASIGKTSKQLTDHEKATALAQATLAQINTKFKDKAPFDFGIAVEQIVTHVTNFRDQLAGAIARSSVLMAGLQALAPALTVAFGPIAQSLIQGCVSLIEHFAIGLAVAARGAVAAAGFIVGAYQDLRITFAKVFEEISAGVNVAATDLASLAGAAGKLPGPVGAAFRSMQQGLSDLANSAAGAKKSFGDQTKEALIAAAAQQAAFGRMDTALAKVQQKMIDGLGSTVKAGAAWRGFGKDTGEAGNLAIQNAQKIAAETLKLQNELALAGKTGIEKRKQEIENAAAEELARITELTHGEGAAWTSLSALVAEKCAAQLAAANLTMANKVRDTTKKLTDDIGSMTQTGLNKRLAQIAAERDKELQTLAETKGEYGDAYDAVVAVTKEKFDLMTKQAQGHGFAVEQLAEQAGFKSRDEMQRTAALALDTYQQMKDSGAYNASQLKDAFIAAENAKRVAAGDTVKFQKATLDDYASAFSSALSQLGGKSKAAALAGATIDLAKAELMTFRTYGWPTALPFMAALAAAGAAQIAKITSAATGFATGTAGLDFADFGAQTHAVLHNQEAVIPRGRGHVLAAEIAAAMPNNGMNEEHLAELKALRRDMGRMPTMLKRALRFSAQMQR
jgi:hypothetical protein